MLLSFFTSLIAWITNSNEKFRKRERERKSVQKYYTDEEIYVEKCALAKTLLTEYNDLATQKQQEAISNEDYKDMQHGTKEAYLFYGALLQLVGYKIPGLDFDAQFVDLNSNITATIDSLWPLITKNHIVEDFLSWNTSSYYSVIAKPYYNSENILSMEDYIHKYKLTYDLCASTVWMEGLRDVAIIDELAAKHGIPPPTKCIGLENTCYTYFVFRPLRPTGVGSLSRAILRNKYGDCKGVFSFPTPFPTATERKRINPWQASIDNQAEYERLQKLYKK